MNKVLFLRLAGFIGTVVGFLLIFRYQDFSNPIRLFLYLLITIISIFTVFFPFRFDGKGYDQRLMRNTNYLLLVSLLAAGIFSFVFAPKIAVNSYINKNINNKNNVSISPSKKYYIRSIGDTQYAELITPKWSNAIVSDPKIEESTIFNSKNVAWSSDEKVVVVTYVTKDTKDKRRHGVMNIVSTQESYKVKNIDLGSGSFYGVSKDSAFPPKISPDGKYIAIQSDLIHSLSIYDINGNLVAKLPTEFKKVPLFSGEMYKLDSGTYSPFLEYEWSKDSKSINYKFEGGKTTYTIDLVGYLNKN